MRVPCHVFILVNVKVDIMCKTKRVLSMVLFFTALLLHVRKIKKIKKYVRVSFP